MNALGWILVCFFSLVASVPKADTSVRLISIAFAISILIWGTGTGV